MKRIREAYCSIAKEFPSLFTAVQLLWQAMLFLLVPSTIATLIVLPLVLSTKAVHVDFRVVIQHVQFTLLSGWRSGREIELIHSAPATQIRVIVASLSIPVERIVDERSGKQFNVRSITFHAREHGWVEMKQDGGNALLSGLNVTAGSHVEINKDGQMLDVRIEPSERVRGEITFAQPFTIIAQDCEIVDQDGRPMDAGAAGHVQQRLRAWPSGVPATLNASARLFLQLNLAGTINDFPGTFAAYLRVRDLAFPPGDAQGARPIERGSLRFQGLEKSPIDLAATFLVLRGDDELELLDVGGATRGVEIVGAGRLSTLRTGRSPDADYEELPSLLDWIYANHKLGVIVGVLAWISATVLAAVKIVDEMKKVTTV
jgi:hypothetical protein